MLTEIQEALVEPVNSGASWASGFWTSQEVVDYLNARQNRFLKETGILLTRASLATFPAVLHHSLPGTWVATRRVTWKDSLGVFVPLSRSDGWEADAALPSWRYDLLPHPLLYMDGDQPTLTLATAPGALMAGQLQILFVALGTTLGSTGVAFTVPDEFVPAVKWGTIADMLGKVGRGPAPARAQYAESRWQEGIMAAKLMLGER